MSVTAVVALALVEVALLLIIGLVAAAETAFTRVDRRRADALAAAKVEDRTSQADADERVEQLRQYARRPITTLASLALVQLVAQAGALAGAWIIGTNLADTAGGIAAVILAGIAVFAVVAVSRTRSLLAPDTTAVGLVPILRAVAPLAPIAAGIVAVGRRFLRPVEPDPDVDEQQLLAIVAATPAIDRAEEALINRVVAFDDTTVGQIMTPRSDLVTLRSGFAVHDALQVAALNGLSRIPVTTIDGDYDDIIGAVHVKDLMEANLDGRGRVDIDLWMRTVPVVPEVQPASHLLANLQRSDFHLAVVVDEHGGVAGVASLEDILEELVGEIEDEFDRPEPEVEVKGTARAAYTQVDGRVEVGRVEEAMGIDLGVEFRTIAGCVFSGLGRVPEVGDLLVLDDAGYELEVLAMHGRRIAQVEVRPIAVSRFGQSA